MRSSSIWDDKYNKTEYHYGMEPLPYLVEKMEKFHPDNLLLPGEGEGRNAVYAAKNGIDVFAFDQSQIARQKALALAKQNGVSIDYRVCDVIESDYPRHFFQMIGLFYVHFSEEIRQRANLHLLEFLRPGGILVLEAFHKRNLGNSFGPQSIEMLYDEAIIKKDFGMLQVEEYYENRFVLSHGRGHQGETEVIRFCAVKLF